RGDHRIFRRFLSETTHERTNVQAFLRQLPFEGLGDGQDWDSDIGRAARSGLVGFRAPALRRAAVHGGDPWWGARGGRDLPTVRRVPSNLTSLSFSWCGGTALASAAGVVGRIDMLARSDRLVEPECGRVDARGQVGTRRGAGANLEHSPRARSRSNLV